MDLCQRKFAFRLPVFSEAVRKRLLFSNVVGAHLLHIHVAAWPTYPADFSPVLVFMLERGGQRPQR